MNIIKFYKLCSLMFIGFLFQCNLNSADKFSSVVKSNELPKNTNPYAMVFGDFDLDKKVDVVIAQPNTKGLNIYFGKDHLDTGFRQATTIDMGQDILESDFVELLTADLDSDRKLDLLVTIHRETGSQIIVFYRNGSGGFTKSITIAFSDALLTSMMSDLDGDGKMEIIVVTRSSAIHGSSYLNIFWGQEKRFNLSPKIFEIPNQFQPKSIAASDFNTDGKQDIIIADYKKDSLFLLLGNEDGSFQMTKNVELSKRPNKILIADMNQDSNADILVLHQEDHAISTFLGNGDATFKKEISVETEGSPQAVQIVDLDQDKVPDLVIATSTTLQMQLGSSNKVQTIADITSSHINRTLWVGDQDNDGKLDVWLGNFGFSNENQIVKGDLSLFKSSPIHQN